MGNILIAAASANSPFENGVNGPFQEDQLLATPNVSAWSPLCLSAQTLRPTAASAISFASLTSVKFCVTVLAKKDECVVMHRYEETKIHLDTWDGLLDNVYYGSASKRIPCCRNHIPAD